MVSAVARVNVTPKLLMVVTVETIGKSARYEIREGATLSDLTYDNNGVEETVSGIVRKINFAYINLPVAQSCEHDTTSMFAAQVVIQSMVLDCSSNFKSDIRTIGVYNIRSIGEVINAEETPLPVAPDTDAEINRVVIAGKLDIETGILSNVTIKITFNKTLEALAAVKAGILTITSTGISSKKLSELSCLDDVVDGVTVLTVSGVDDIDMTTLKSATPAATLTAGEKSMNYTLTADDYPVWDPSQIPMKVNVIEATATYIKFALVNAPAVPDFVVLNEDHVLNTVTKDQTQGDNEFIINYSAGMEDHACKTTGNIITIVGDGYSVESAEFDGPVVEPAEDADVAYDVNAAIEAIPDIVGAATDDIFTKAYVDLIPVLPEDVDVTLVTIGSTTYHDEDSIDVIDEATGTTAIMGMYDEVSTVGVKVNALAVMMNANEVEGSCAISISTGKKAAASPVRRIRSVFNASTYDFNLTGVAPTERLTVAAVAVENKVDGYVVEATNEGNRITVNREHYAPVIRVNMGVIPGKVAYVKTKRGEYDAIYVCTVTETGLALPGINSDDPIESASNTTMDYTVIIPGVGRCNLSVTLNNTVAEDLALEAVKIEGEPDRHGVITAPTITLTLNKDAKEDLAKIGSLKIVGAMAGGDLTSLGAVTVEGKTVTVITTEATVDITKVAGAAVIVKYGDTIFNPDSSIVTVPEWRAPYTVKKVTLSGEPDIEGKIASATLKVEFAEEVTSLTGAHVTIADLAITEVSLDAESIENSAVEVSLENVDVSAVQGRDDMVVAVYDGKWDADEYTLAVEDYPAWRAAWDVTKVYVTGEPDHKTGIIETATLSIDVTSADVTEIADATITIEELGVQDLSLADAQQLTVPIHEASPVVKRFVKENVQVTLKTSYAAGGVKAAIYDGKWNIEKAMEEVNDYPSFKVALFTPTSVKVTGTPDDDHTGTISNATIEVGFADDVSTVEMTGCTIDIAELGVEGQDLSGATKEGTKATLTSVAVTLKESYAEDGVKAVVSDGFWKTEITMSEGEEGYPKYTPLVIEELTFNDITPGEDGAITSGNIVIKMNKKMTDEETAPKLTIAEMGITSLDMTKEEDESATKWKLDLSNKSAHEVKVLDGEVAPETVTVSLLYGEVEGGHIYTADAPKEDSGDSKKYPVWNEPALALKSVNFDGTGDPSTGIITSSNVTVTFNHEIRDYEGTDGSITVDALAVTAVALTTVDHITYTGTAANVNVKDHQADGADAKVIVNSKEYTLHLTAGGGFPSWQASEAV